MVETIKKRLETPEELSKRKHDRLINDLRGVISTPGGRRVCWWILKITGIFRLSYTGETNSTMFNEGKTSNGLNILELIMEANPNAFMQMQRENASEAKMEETNAKEKEQEKDILKTDGSS